MFFTAFLCFEDLEIIQVRKTKANRKPYNKVTKLKFSLILGQFNLALNNLRE